MSHLPGTVSGYPVQVIQIIPVYPNPTFISYQPTHVDPTEGLTEEDLPRIVSEMEELQQQFDQIAIQKFNLNKKINDYSEKLKSLTELINR